MNIHALPLPVLLSAVFVISLVIGSFLNVVVWRLPQMLERGWKTDCCELLELDKPPESETSFNLLIPGSRCPHCQQPIRAWQNVPLLSFILLRGRCAHCKALISWRYPLLELCTAVLSAYFIWHFGATVEGLLALLFLWGLIALTVIDLDTQLLPDNITLSLLWLGLIVNSAGVFTSLPNAVYGAVFGYLALWSIYWLFRLLTGKEGMGYGDFKLLAALGAWLGWQSLPTVVLLSSLVGAMVGIAAVLLLGRDKNVPIPFGPYLAVAGLITLLWGDQLSQYYLQVSNLQ